LFLKVLEQARQRYGFVVVGYVVMPEHVHLLIGEPEKADPSRVVQAAKQGFARRVLKRLRRGKAAAQAELFASHPTFAQNAKVGHPALPWELCSQLP
jgi:REP element-mobilizing transposase RayT